MIPSRRLRFKHFERKSKRIRECILLENKQLRERMQKLAKDLHIADCENKRLADRLNDAVAAVPVEFYGYARTLSALCIW